MEPRQYVAILVRRWLILVAAAFVGIVGSGVITLLTVATYTSSASVLFTAEQGTRAAEALQGEQYAEASVASFVDLARTPAVLGSVIDALSLPLSTAQLRDAVTVEVVPDTTVVEITATMSSADDALRVAATLSRQLRLALDSLAPGAGSSGLTVTEVSPPQRPQAQSAPNSRQNMVAGAGLGVVLGVAVACILEARRPRLAGRRDLESLTDLPIWELPQTAGRSGVSPEPQHRMDRLTLLIGSGNGLTDVASISGDSGPERPGFGGELARSLVASLSGRGQAVDLLPTSAPLGSKHLGVVDVRQRRGAESGDVAVLTTRRLLVAEPGRTSRQELQRFFASPHRSRQLLGVVLAPRHDESAGLRRLVRRLADPDPRPVGGGLRLGPGGAPVAISTGITALAAVGLAGMSYPLPFGTNTALIASVALAPIWLSVLSSYRYARPLLGLAIAALVAGFLLADWSSADHAFDGRIAAETSFRFLGAFGTVGLILWSRKLLPLAWIGVTYGGGAVLTALPQVPGSPNPWKFQLAFGVTIVAVAMASQLRRSTYVVGVLGGLGLISIVLDFRSWFAFCAMAAVLVIWQARPRNFAARLAPRVVSLIALVTAAVAGYTAATFAIVEGYLGDELQQRSLQQIQASGSLIAGGRPEWTVTWVLMQDRPMGFGIGIVPNSQDVLAGREGLSSVNVPFQSGYVEFLFGGQFKLHSVAADFWSMFGILGLVLAAALVFIMLSSLSSAISGRWTTPLVLLLLVTNLWNLVFQPIYSSLPSTALLLGLILTEQRNSDKMACE